MLHKNMAHILKGRWEKSCWWRRSSWVQGHGSRSVTGIRDVSNTEHCVLPSPLGTEGQRQGRLCQGRVGSGLSRGEGGNSHSPRTGQNAPRATLLVFHRTSPSCTPAHLSASQAKLGAQNQWEFKKHCWWEGRMGKTSKARSNHLHMVSSVPFGTVTCSLRGISL